MYVPIGTAGGIYLAIAGLGGIAALALGSRVPRAVRRVFGWGCLSVAALATAFLAAGHLPDLTYATVVPFVALVTVFGTLAFAPLEHRDVLLIPAGIGIAVLAYFAIEAILELDGRAHPVRRRLRARRGPLLRPAERLHRPADRRVPVDRAAAPDRRRLRAPGGRRRVRRVPLPRREPRRRRVAVRGGRPVARDPRTRTARRVEGPRGVRRRDRARHGPDPRGPRDLAVRDARDEVRGAGGRARGRAREGRGTGSRSGSTSSRGTRSR